MWFWNKIIDNYVINLTKIWKHVQNNITLESHYLYQIVKKPIVCSQACLANNRQADKIPVLLVLCVENHPVIDEIPCPPNEETPSMSWRHRGCRLAATILT